MLSPPPKLLAALIVSNSKNPLKYRDWALPAVRYFTWKVDFALNILWMIVACISILYILYILYINQYVKPLVKKIRHKTMFWQNQGRSTESIRMQMHGSRKEEHFSQMVLRNGFYFKSNIETVNKQGKHRLFRVR